MTFYCIADEDTVRGFRLAGVRGEVVETAPEAGAALARAADDPECGIIILTQGIASGVRRQLEALRLERERPLILEIPGPSGPAAGGKTLRQFVQEAVGISLGAEGGE